MAKAEQKTITPNDFGPDTRDQFRVLKHDGNFAVFSETGCMNGVGTGPSELHCKDGFFHFDTRILSRYILSINGTKVVPLGSGISDDTAVFSATLANSRLTDGNGKQLPPYSVGLQRDRFLRDGLFDRLVLTNFTGEDVCLDISLDLWADFRDIFEVRGVRRDVRGQLGSPRLDGNTILFRYTAADGVPLRTQVAFDRPPANIGGRAHFQLRLAPNESDSIETTIRPVLERDETDPGLADSRAIRRARAIGDLEAKRGRLDLINSNRPRFDNWLRRSAADLALLTSDLESGFYPYAGIPWFSAPFGRDAIITALQTLWLDPSLARGVLRFLAVTQATDVDDRIEAQPGKILHEARKGEMARLGEVPFGRYYGGVDQTLLFVVLAWETYRRTGDADFLETLRPHVEAALEWAATWGDPDGDGYVEYSPSRHGGLRNQGWKDSDNALFHADGRLAEGAIALVEVQAYHVAAKRAAASILEVLGDGERPERLRSEADALVEAIDRDFWDDDLRSWIIALDGEKRPVRVMTSNAGHLLFAGAANPERIAAFSERMDGDDILTHWGYRTVARGEALYNPMGYHTGSIWPHDNAIIAAGFARHGGKARACRVATAMFNAADEFHDQRLPELYCGFDRNEAPRLVSYPSACSPQAWAAGAPFMCLQACLGLQIDVPARRIHVVDPQLPAGLEHLEICRLDVAGRRLDMRFVEGHGGRPHLEVLKAPTELNFTFDIRRPD